MLHVHTRAAPNVSFEQYRTFAIGSGEEAPAGYQRSRVTPEVLSVVDSEVRGTFVALRYQEVPIADADLIVRVGAGVRKKSTPPAPDQDSVGSQVSDEDLDGAFVYTDGTLVIDVFDAKMKRRIWHGASREIIRSGSVDRARLESATRHILAHFPKVATSG